MISRHHLKRITIIYKTKLKKGSPFDVNCELLSTILQIGTWHITRLEVQWDMFTNEKLSQVRNCTLPFKDLIMKVNKFECTLIRKLEKFFLIRVTASLCDFANAFIIMLTFLQRYLFVQWTSIERENAQFNEPITQFHQRARGIMC